MTENESIRPDGEPDRPGDPDAISPASAGAGPVSNAEPVSLSDVPTVPQPAVPAGPPQPPAGLRPPAAASVSPWAQPSYYGEPWAQQGNPGQPGNPGPHYPPHTHSVPQEGWAQATPVPAVPAPVPSARPSRAGKVVAIAAAAVALALTSGTVGAVAALGLNDSRRLPAASRPHTADPVIDRSSLSDIAQAVQPSVVSVRTQSGEGSGVVLSADGFVLTNNHVVASARGTTVTLLFSNGRTGPASIVGTDPKTDLAVVKARDTSGLTAATFGDSDAMRVGDTVLALGSPLGLAGSVTVGIVSAVNRTIQVGGRDGSPFETPSQVTSISGVIQTDAAINPGNSGGALVNLDGQVIGINTAIATAGNGSGNIGVGFAIPSNKAKQVAEQLRKGEKVSHAFLGVSVTPAEGGGAEVTDVASGSPAALAGLQRGDVITRVGEALINDSDDLISAVQSHRVGDRLEITYTRSGAEKKTTATLAEASN